MYKLIIKFPFQSVNDEQYMLVLQMRRPGAYANALAAMAADTRCFKFLEEYNADDEYKTLVDVWEGTLCGSVRAEDDSRDDMFAPLCPSKLKFSIACQDFPAWLMDACGYARDVRVILYAVTGNIDTPLRVRWRGYLQCNTLNMTVVNDLLACPVVAVDEIGVAKYLPFRANSEGRPAHLSLYQLFKKWWTMNWTEYFLEAYTDLGLATNQQALFFARNICYKNDADLEVVDILQNLHINLERYYLDKDATWQNVLEDVCQYLGVHFSIGAYNGNNSYDNYLLSSYDEAAADWLNLVYTFSNNYVSSRWQPRYSSLGNQAKVGADLQVTYEPDEYKGVKVESVPERPPVHDYLGVDNMRAIAPASGHHPWAECRIGQYNGSTADPSGDSNSLDYWRLIYMEIISKQDQWTEEADYIELEDCEVSTEGRFIGGSGYFPMTDAPLGHARPTGEDTDSIEFVMEKRGLIPVQLGSMAYKTTDWQKKMTNYLMLLNNVWGRLYWDEDMPYSTDMSQPYKVATIYPFGLDQSILPAGVAYLAIDFAALILNENIGTGDKIFQSDGLGQSHNFWRILYGHDGSVFPMTKTYHDYTDDDENTTGKLIDNGTTQRVVHYAPFLTVRLRIGNWFFYYDWNYNNTGWTYYADPDDAPTFRLPLIGNAHATWDNLTGYGNLTIDNYYYTELHPASNVIDPVFFVPLQGVSTGNTPLEGRVELEIWWPTPYLNYYHVALGSDHYNNILSILINDIDIRFTDDADIAGTDIKVSEKIETDPTSDTKKLKEVTLSMSTPKVDGVFSNCLVYDGLKSWHNLQTVFRQSSADATTPEKLVAEMVSAVYNRPQVWVELQRQFAASDYGDVANLDFRVSNLTEASGTFVPVERKFDFTKGWVRWKLQRLA